eukprot:1157711-Pelagomonas_calceolata.AAC.18
MHAPCFVCTCAGDAFSPRRLFEAPALPSHPLFRKEGQSITSTVGRRSLQKQSRSRSHHSPRASSSGGGGGSGGGLLSQSFEGFGSCPSSPGPEVGGHSKTGGEGSARQSGPLSGRGSSSLGGAADMPNYSALSIEPWLAEGVVEQGGRSFNWARGSGRRRRSSGAGLGSPLGGLHTPGRSPSMKRRSESWYRRAGSGTHEREGSWTGGEDGRAASLAGRGSEGLSGAEGEEVQQRSQEASRRSSSDFSAILKKQPLQRCVWRKADAAEASRLSPHDH